VHGEGQEGQEGINAEDGDEASLANESMVEEPGHSLGHQVIVILDEAVPGAADTFVAEQGVSREVAKDLYNSIVREAGQCVPLVGASSISSVCSRMRAWSVIRALKRKIIQQF
jgi:hypothetical protein